VIGCLVDPYDFRETVTAREDPVTLPDPTGLVRADAAIPGGLVAGLRASGYGPDSLDAVERCVPTVLGAGRLPLIESVLAEGVPGAAAAALFCYGLELSLSAAERGLGAATVAACRTHGVLLDGPQGLRSPWRLIPFLGVLVASDRPDAGAEAVMGPGPTTMHLAEAALPAPGARVLDLGCGAGSLALVAKQGGAGAVIAVDLNLRAVEVARANAALNRLAIDCRAGDLLAPVGGETFDLIISQPPYVVLPPGQHAVTYLHGGPRGDELARRVLAEVPAALLPGGLALVHFDGPADRESELVGEVARSANAPVDIAVLAQPGLPPMVQAMSYATLLHGGFGAGYAEAVRGYLAHCRAAGLTSFGRYLVALRRSARGWGVRLRVANGRGPDRAAIDALIAGLDLADAGEAELLRCRIRPPACAELTLHRPFGSPEVQRIAAGYRSGFWPGHDIDEQTGALCDLLAGSDSVAAAVAVYAQDCAEPPAEAQRLLLAFVRDGLRRGMLVVV
jgi:SAM-dependent methyltransferase